MTLLTIVLLTANLILLALLLYRREKPRVSKPSQELVDFFQDLKVHGYAVVRIDPALFRA